jgi:hypothetical protein
MLKNGVEDVKMHKWFEEVDWRMLLSKKVPMEYKPTVKFPGDTSNFNPYPDDQVLPPPLKSAEDPFINW